MEPQQTNTITVSELNESIKAIISESIRGSIKISGEISNLKCSNSNTYLTLKDDTSSINVVSWRHTFPDIKNGDSVIVTGKLDCYVKGGTYNITTYNIKKMGLGELHQKYLELKDSFEKKGYFSKKRQLPNNISRIGILTASGGAALQDIMYVLKNNNFTGEIYIKNCLVQGNLCSKSIKDGIKYFNKLPILIDVIIITRGGGSFEDLMGYSKKQVVKSIYKSSIITISAVGHEIDYMLSDYASDIRCPTPSLAGELISSYQRKQRDTINKHVINLEQIKISIQNTLDKYSEQVENHQKILASMNPISFINNEISRLERIKQRNHDHIKCLLDDFMVQIENLHFRNETYNTQKILQNGFICIVDENNQMIDKKGKFLDIFRSHQKMKFVFVDGEINSNELYE